MVNKPVLIHCLQLLLCCSALPVFAQPEIGNLHVKSIYPVYKLSPDERTVAIFEVSADRREEYARFLNLADFTWQEKRSFNLNHMRIALSPDFSSVYGNVDDIKGGKGDGNWMPYKKYMAWYFPDSKDESKKRQWADQFFILTKMRDGKLLAGTGFELTRRKGTAYPRMSIRELVTIDPSTGQVAAIVHTFPKSKPFEMPDIWRKPTTFLVNDEKLLLSAGNGIYSLNLATGEARQFSPIVQPTAVVGKYGMGTGFDHQMSTMGNHFFRKSVTDLETGTTVYEGRVAVKQALGYWAAASGEHFYTLNGLSSMLVREKLVGGKLMVLDSVKLDIKGVLPGGDNWGDRGDNQYRLFVTEDLGKVVMLPGSWNSSRKPADPLLAWNLEDGKLIFISPDFIQPSYNHLADLNRPAGPATIPLNTLVKVQNDYYVLLKKDETYKKWSVIKFVRDRQGNYEKVRQERDLMDFAPVTTKVISATPCGRCNGSGVMAVQKSVTYEKTDKMIYNQITTTTTKNVTAEGVCSDCRGLGFSGAQ